MLIISIQKATARKATMEERTPWREKMTTEITQHGLFITFVMTVNGTQQCQ